MLNLIFKIQNLSDFSYFLLNIAHFYASNFVNRLFLQRSHMIKPIILILAAATTLSACNTLEKESVPMTGMPNPASEFCVKQGGKLEIKKDKDGGEYGMCHLPDGIVVEEWAYFRQHNK